MSWENPLFLWLLVLVAVLITVSFLYRTRLRQARARYFSDDVFGKLYSSEIPRVRQIKSISMYTGVVFLIITLAGPQIGTEIREVERRGIDIMVALDVSRSMLAEDVRPNRLDKAKFEVLRMIDRLRGDRVGLISFTGEAVQLSPFTTDYSAFRLYLNIADPTSMPSGTTDFAEAMRTAINAFDATADDDQNTARVLLLISDGEHHGPDFTSFKNQLAQRNIYIHTVGIGTTAGAAIPIYDSNTGRLIDYVRDSNDQVVTTRLERDVLRNIAEVGRGRYYEISRSADGMDGFISQIADLEQRSFATQEFADYKKQYQWFAAIGLLFLVLSVTLPRYRPPVIS